MTTEKQTVEAHQTWITKGWDNKTNLWKFEPVFFERLKGEKMKRVSLKRGIELMADGTCKINDVNGSMRKWLKENNHLALAAR